MAETFLQIISTFFAGICLSLIVKYGFKKAGKRLYDKQFLALLQIFTGIDLAPALEEVDTNSPKLVETLVNMYGTSKEKSVSDMTIINELQTRRHISAKEQNTVLEARRKHKRTNRTEP